MAVRPICFYPNPMLTKPSQIVLKTTKQLHHMVQDLEETLHHQPGGIGIAAPQIGVPYRIAIIDLSKKEKEHHPLVLINPEVLETGGNVLKREGCMSIPDYTGNVARAAWVRIQYQDENFDTFEHVATGLEAICIQHEIDHLNGFLFIHRVASMNRDIFRRKKYL